MKNVIKNAKDIFSGRNFRYGAVSVVITVTVILFIVLFNVVLTFLFKKYPLNIDLTENQVFEISKDTGEFLAALDQDVVIYVMNTESRFVSSGPQEYFIQANEVIHKYAQYSSRIRLEYVDLIRNPDFGSRYPDVELNVNDVLLTSRNKYRKLASSDLFNIRSSYYGSYVTSSKAEQAMTSALLNITSGKIIRAALISGHNEQDAGAFTELLRLNSYEVTDVNLFTGDVPRDISTLILAAPVRDFSPVELQRLDAFLEGGDNRVLLYFAALSQPNLPNLAEYLGEWGIAADTGVVFETDNSRLISPSPYIAFVDYAEDKYSKNMAQKDLLPVMPQARPLRALFNEARYRSVAALLRFSATSGVRPADAPDDWNPGPSQITGNVPALLLSSQLRNNAAGDLVHAYVLACGSIFAVDGSILGSPNIANSGYFLDLLSALTGREDHIYIQDKTMGFAELGANALQIMIIAAVFAALLPLAVLGAGVAVWLRRRHR
jgi:hypothetical protein